MSTPESGTEFPVQSAVRTLNIGDHTTDIFVQKFTNTLLVTVSQCRGQPGSLIEVKSENPVQRGDIATSFNFNLLFGVETQEILLAARVLAESLSKETDQTILLSLALKDTSKTTLSTLCQEVRTTLQSVN